MITLEVRDYIVVAEVIQKARATHGKAAEKAIVDIENDLATIFSEDNPSFSRSLFLSACRAHNDEVSL